MSSDDPARNRFILLNLARIGGTALVVAGLIIAETDWLRPGGWPQLGLPLVIIGLIETLFVPRMLARRWRSPPLK